MSFLDELKYSFKAKNNFNILIYINLIVFLFIQLFKVFFCFSTLKQVKSFYTT